MEDRAANAPDDGTHARGDRSETPLVGPPVTDGTDSDAPLRTIRAEFTLAHEDIALTQATAQSPNVTVRPEQAVADGTATLLVLTVMGAELDAFERALDADESVAALTRLGCSGDGWCYRATLAEGAMAVSPLLVRTGARVVDVVGSGGDWDVTAQFRSREAFAAFRRHCADSGVSFRLHRLCRDDGETERRSGLTAEQWSVLRQAHEAGYFDVPRSASQAELADRLGVSPSAVSQRLRRATGRLVEAQLDTDDA